MDKFSFYVTAEPVRLEDGSVMAAVVEMRFADGRRISGSVQRPLDATELLARGARSGEFDLLTCSCGVAGCAGIFDEVRATVEGETVRWVLPQLPYSALLGASDEVELVFEKRDYEQALADLESSLLALEQVHGALAMPPLGYEERVTEVQAVSGLLAKVRQAAQEHDDKLQCFNRCFGQMAGEQLEIRLPELHGVLTVQNFARAVAQSRKARALAALEEVWLQAAEQLSVSPTAALDAWVVDWNDWFEWSAPGGPCEEPPDLSKLDYQVLVTSAVRPAMR